MYIKDAVQKYWKSNEFEFIDQQEFNKRRFDSKYSFLVLMKVAFDKDPAGVSYNYINLVLGDTANDMTRMPELCSIPLSYYNDNNINNGYAIPAIVKFMQKHVKKIQNRHFLISLFGLKYYNGKLKLRDKILLLNKNDLAEDANSPEKIKTVYPILLNFFLFRRLNQNSLQTRKILCLIFMLAQLKIQVQENVLK